MKFRNVFFLMLFLIIYQITNLSAQVRIGGLTKPNPATVLDLNANDATNDGSKGLALPRVSLSDTLALLNGTTPPDGTMVFNTNTGLGEGIYVWGANKWSQVIAPLRADSGQYMQYNGTTWNPATLGVVYRMAVLYDSASADSTGFNTMEVLILDCPCVLDMVPVHYGWGVSHQVTDDKYTIWSVYFENHRDSIYKETDVNGIVLGEAKVDVYTMGYMILTTDGITGKQFWGTQRWGGPPVKAQFPTYPVFRCLKY